MRFTDYLVSVVLAEAEDYFRDYLVSVIFTEAPEGYYGPGDIENYLPEEVEGFFSEEFLAQARADLAEFLIRVGPELLQAALEYQDMGQIAHDLWLTRNRHGAGFWDGEYPKKLGDRLTIAAHEMGEVHVSLGYDLIGPPGEEPWLEEE